MKTPLTEIISSGLSDMSRRRESSVASTADIIEREKPVDKRSKKNGVKKTEGGGRFSFSNNQAGPSRTVRTKTTGTVEKPGEKS